MTSIVFIEFFLWISGGPRARARLAPNLGAHDVDFVTMPGVTGPG
jgi:hypothetical protein